MDSEAQSFWLVWRQGSVDARYKHETRRSALIEAKRLAGHNPNEKFFVLQATDAVINAPITHYKLADEIPF
ncbi:MAG: hypothetical protein AAGA36_00080 [Pseudomonadota bacterium]